MFRVSEVRGEHPSKELFEQHVNTCSYLEHFHMSPGESYVFKDYVISSLIRTLYGPVLQLTEKGEDEYLVPTCINIIKK
jgi:hypothetical protein